MEEVSTERERVEVESEERKRNDERNDERREGGRGGTEGGKRNGWREGGEERREGGEEGERGKVVQDEGNKIHHTFTSVLASEGGRGPANKANPVCPT